MDHEVRVTTPSNSADLVQLSFLYQERKWRSRDKIFEGSTRKEGYNSLSNPDGNVAACIICCWIRSVIKAFCEEGKPYYEGKSSSGHIWWDIYDCDECKDESIDDDDQPRGRKEKSLQQSLKERYEAGDPEVDLLGEPFGKFDYYVFYPKTKKQKP